MRKVIAIEGIDGSGKTSLGNRLKDYYSSYFDKVGYIKVPQYIHQKLASFVGKKFYRMMIRMEEANNRVLTALFLRSMTPFYKLAEIEENSSTLLLVERHPLIDSYVYSLIYFKNFQKIVTPFLEKAIRIKKPDIILFLYCNPIIAMKRIINRFKTVGDGIKNMPHLHERPYLLDVLQKKFKERVRQLEEKGTEVILVDVSKRNKEEVFNYVKERLNELFDFPI